MRQDGRSGTPARRRTAAAAGVPGRAPAGYGLLPIAVDGAIRGALAMLAGFALTSAIGLLLWTITPDVSGGPEQMLRGSTAAYVLAHFGTVQIGSSALTITPLLLTLIFVLLLVLGPARGRTSVPTAAAEAVSVGCGAVSYGALVTAATVTLAPAGARDGWAGLWATAVAVIALGVGMLWHGVALREWVLEQTPRWLRVGAAAACGAVAVLVGGAALATAGALVASFSTAADLTDRLAGGVGDGIGLTLTGAGYLPNLVLGAVGYLVGTGFVVGPGTYSPFGSVLGDLPPFPPLAAVPDSSGASTIGLVLLVVPVAAAVVAGVLVMRGVSDRVDRLRGVLIAAAAAGLLTGLLVWLGSGGVSGGAWSHIGAVGWQVGLVTAAAVLVLAGSWVLAAGYGAHATGAVKGAGARFAGRGGATQDVADDEADGSDGSDGVDPETDDGRDADRDGADADTDVTSPEDDSDAWDREDKSGDAAQVETGEVDTEGAATAGDRTGVDSPATRAAGDAADTDAAGTDEADTDAADTDAADPDAADPDPADTADGSSADSESDAGDGAGSAEGDPAPEIADVSEVAQDTDEPDPSDDPPRR